VLVLALLHRMMMPSLALTRYSDATLDGLLERTEAMASGDGNEFCFEADLVCYHYQHWGEQRYGFTDAPECARWMAYPTEAFNNVLCCNTAGCNAPKQAVYRAGSTIVPSPPDTTGRK
jgi:hypothetical protein